MATRRLRATDLEQASAICMASFMEAVAPSLSPQAAGQVVGVAELMGGRHVATLFVAPGWQGKGVGRALMQEMLECARADVVTVRASLGSVPAYERYGFEVTGEVGEQRGLVYQPMALGLGVRWLGGRAAD
jgi:predicted N-acetyltransferase YhbS